MKKIYMQPVMISMTVNVERMISTSGPEMSNDDADQEYGQDTKSSGSYGVWDDED